MERDGLAEDSVWYEPLTPTAFLSRAALVYSDRVAAIDGDRRFTYAELWERSRRLAGAILDAGGGRGARVAVLAPNTHVLLEAHYGVPLSGSVLVAMNTRLTAEEYAYIIDHSEAAIFLFDEDFADTAKLIAGLVRERPVMISVGGKNDAYEALLAAASPQNVPVTDERATISINYTSGTTGKPKGVVYHHRGAYLQAIAMAFHTRLDPASVFLWTLPMFHCNGWCFPWAVTAAGGTHLCLRKLDPPGVWRLIEQEGVTHFNGAPTVLTMLAHDPAARPASRPIRVCTGGAPPSPTLLARMASLNVDVMHLYGLTETFGPIVVCDWRPEWNELSIQDAARIKARQGVGNVISVALRVVDGEGSDVPPDGQTMGEILLRGNNVMAGYYRDPEATARATANGWFRTGDLGVMHPDGYIELKDRSKDIIISGGENISTVEVEQAVCSHPAVLEAAVIAVPDDQWGEVPAAYVTLVDGASVTEDEIIEHVRGRIAHFKAPKTVEFGPLPKTSTGKIQKYVLREAAWRGREKRIG
jgi:acyl-CoA synthetase (AMP-forming)/AMP-acid ligase II